MVLRHTRPELPRPYRTWGYPVTPLIFLSVTIFVMIHLLIERPKQSLWCVATMLAGLGIYWLWLRQASIPSNENGKLDD
jgi:APA family basic amino acid/polyamine antiporter